MTLARLRSQYRRTRQELLDLQANRAEMHGRYPMGTHDALQISQLYLQLARLAVSIVDTLEAQEADHG